MEEIKLNEPIEIAARVFREVGVVHAEAFQLMLYRAEDGAEAWFWNSRDGVTPFGTTVDGKEFRHAMQGYKTRYLSVLPAEAQYVWVTYDRIAWRAMQERNFEKYSAEDGVYAVDFRDRFPTIDVWLAVSPFEFGQPRQMTRAEFLAETPEFFGRPGKL